MKAQTDPAKAAQAVLLRADQLAQRLPGGYARMLWRRVLLIQEDQYLPEVAMILACAGAQIDLITTQIPEWDDNFHPAFLQEILLLLEQREPRFRLDILRQINPNNFSCGPGYTIHQVDQQKWCDAITDPIDTILVDGASYLLDQPKEFLKTLHKLSPTGGIIDITSKNEQFTTNAQLDQIRQLIVTIGFGLRHVNQAMPGQSAGNIPDLSLGLIRLDAPMTDFPIIGRENPQIMAHCNARLDIAAQLVKDCEVLDAGGATGIGAKRYIEAGAKHVVSLEVVQEAIDIGNKALASEIEDGLLEMKQWDLNVSPLPFPDHKFDVVICLEVLEHIRNQDNAIKEFKRILKPGGVLLVSIPDADFELAISKLNQFENPFHISVPTRDDLKNMVRGLKIVKWLHQADTIGSIVTEDKPKSKIQSSQAIHANKWDVTTGSGQVVMALCRKPVRRRRKTTRNNSNESSAKSNVTIPKSLVSNLRLFGHTRDTMIQSQLRQRELEQALFTDRYQWWSRTNILTETISTHETELAALHNNATDLKTRLSEEHKATENEQICLRLKIEQINLKRSHLQDEISQLKQSLQINLSQLHEQREHFDNEHKRSTEEQNRSDEERKRFDKECKRFELERKRFAQAQARFDTERDHLQNQISLERKQYTSNHDKHVAELDKLIHAFQFSKQSNADLANKHDQLEATLANERKRLDESKRQIHTLQSILGAIKYTLAIPDCTKSNSTSMSHDLDSIHAAIQSLIADRDLAQQVIQETQLNYKQDKQKWNTERAQLLHRLGDQLGNAIVGVERRCLSIESRVYDMEDHIDNSLTQDAHDE